MADKELSIIVKAKDAASSVLRSAEKQFLNFSKGVQRSMQEVVNSSQQFALIAGTVATGAGLIGKSFLQASADLEQTELFFNKFFGSVENGNRIMSELNSFALETPFEVTQVRDAAIQVAAYGVEQEKLIPTLRLLGDLSIGNAQKFDRLVLAYGQARAAGKLYGTELRQFTEAGIPLLDALSDTTGIAMENIREAVSLGVITFEDMETALQSLGGEGGRFNNLMKDGAQTLGGVFSNIVDAWTRLKESFRDTTAYQAIKDLTNQVLEFAQKALPVAVQKINELTVWLQNNQETVIAIAGAIAGGLTPAIVSAILAFAGMIARLSPFMALGALIVTHWDEVKAVMYRVSDAVKDLRKWFAEHERATIALSSGITVALIPALLSLARTITFTVLGALAKLAVAFAPFFVTGAVIAGIVYGIMWASERWDIVMNTIGRVTEVVINKVIDIINLMGTQVEKVADKVGLDWDLTLDHISITTETASSRILVAVNSMVDGVIAAMQRMKNSIVSGMNFVAQVASGNEQALGVVKDKMNTHFDGMGDKAFAMASKVSQGFTKMKEIAAAEAAKTQAATEKMASGGSSALERFNNANKETASGAKKAAEEIVNAYEKIIDAAKNKLERVGTSYDNISGKLKKLTDDHRKTIGELKKDLQELEDSLALLGTGAEQRTVDFRKGIADDIVRIEKDLSEAKNELMKATDEEEINSARQKVQELENILANNAGFIKSIESEVRDARMLAEMDEIARKVELYNRETEELRMKNERDIAMVKDKIAQENAAFKMQTDEYIRLLTLQSKASLKTQAEIEGWTKEHLDRQLQDVDAFFQTVNSEIQEQADSPHLDAFVFEMDRIIERAQKALKAIDDLNKATGGHGINLGGPIGTPLAKGGIVTRPTTALIGEGGEPEAVIPLSKSKEMGFGGGGTVINVNISGGVFDSVENFVDLVSEKLASKVSLIS